MTTLLHGGQWMLKDREGKAIRSGDCVDLIVMNRRGRVEYCTDVPKLRVDVLLTHDRLGNPLTESERRKVSVHPNDCSRLPRDVPPEIVDRVANECRSGCCIPNVASHRCYGRSYNYPGFFPGYTRDYYNPSDMYRCNCDCHRLPSKRLQCRYEAHAKCAEFAILYLQYLKAIAMDSESDTSKRRAERLAYVAEMVRRNGTHSDEIAADEERFDCSVFPGAEFDFPRR
jgi:hypothetical protein